MKNLLFYIPKIEDYWYEQKIQSDLETMNYISMMLMFLKII